MNFNKNIDLGAPQCLKRARWRNTASICAAIAASLICVDPALAVGKQSAAKGQLSSESDNPYAEFMTRYIEWAQSIEAEGQKRGTPLDAQQIDLAHEIGIKHPEKVRLVFVDTVPFPTEDESLRQIGEGLGFIGAEVINNAQAFGYTIWVRKGFMLDRPSLAHELVHVAQIERSESFGAYARQYMLELSEHGHAAMPLELEAYEANRKFGPSG